MTGPRMQPAETRQAVVRASVIMFVAITLGRVLGFGRDAVISHLYGQGMKTDVFNMAFVVPDLLYFLIAGGALTAAFIPVFTDYLTRGDEHEAWRLFSILATFLTAVIASLVVLGEVFSVPLARLLLMDNRFSPQDVQDCARLMRIVLPAQVCFFLGGLMMGSLQSRQRFMAPAVGPLIYNAAIITGGLLLARRLGIDGFAWGALVGAVIGNVIVQYEVLRRVGLRFRPQVDLRHPGVRRVAGMMLAVTLSLALPQILMSLTRMFATRLDSGVITALTNTNRLMQAPLAMFGQSLAVALLPTLSAMAALRDTTEFRGTLSRSIRFILFATVPTSVLMMVLSTPIIRTMYQHGHFTAHDTSVAAPILAVYCTAIAAWSIQAVVARACFALGDNRTPVYAGLAVTALFVALNLGLVRVAGGPGLAAATSLAGVAIAGVMAEVLRRRLGGIEGGSIVRTLGQTLVACVPLAAAAWGAAHVVGRLAFFSHGHGVLLGLAQCVAGTAAGGAVFLAAAALIRMPEVDAALARVRRKLAR